jgi:hypothetical protein
MNKGEKEMAVVTYTVSMVGGVPTISPNPGAVTFLAGDYLIFNRAPGTPQEVVVKVIEGPDAPNKPVIVVAIAGNRRVMVDPPELNGDGDVLITFTDAGGNKNGFPP